MWMWLAGQAWQPGSTAMYAIGALLEFSGLRTATGHQRELGGQVYRCLLRLMQYIEIQPEVYYKTSALGLNMRSSVI